MVNWISLIIYGTVLYIGIDLFFSWRRGEFQIEKIKKSLKGFGEAIKNVGIKEFAIAFIVFLLMFILVRGFVIVQDEMQECSVWVNNEMYSAINHVSFNYYEVNGIFYDEMSLYSMKLDELISEQNRSYNYYRRGFNKIGGRANFVNIVCNLEFSFDRFIKNVKLDMSEVRTQ